MDNLTDSIAAAQRVLASSSLTDDAVATSSDARLIDAVSLAGSLVREIQVVQSRLAAEVARRSRRELGHAGLAARRGSTNAVTFVAALTRCSRADAAQQIRVGELMALATGHERSADGAPVAPFGQHDPTATADSAAADDPDSRVASLAPLVDAVRGGVLGIDGADQVSRTLLPVIHQVDPELLRDATAIIGAEAATRNADDLATMARGVRDTLDRVGVIDRETHLRSQRGLRRGRVVDGLRRVTMVLDPETDAIIIGAIDHAMSPRLGGPRFTASPDEDRARRLIDDDRSNEQIALDVLTDLVKAGVDRDDGAILGSNKPGLRVTIPLADLMAGVDEHGLEHPDSDDARRAGPAWLEGHPEPLSAATGRRLLCDSGAFPVVLSGAGQPLAVGSTRRLFTAAQREAMGVRDGGCMFGDCDRPASWCEAHHIDPFKPKHPGDRLGPTNLENGILLCRRHHMLLHDHDWQILRTARNGEFLLIPPVSVDAKQIPRPMRSKAPPWLRTG